MLRLLRRSSATGGLVFSDDLEMRAIADHFAPADVTRAALGAGVDALLVCSRADLRDAVLAALEAAPDALVERALARLAGFKRLHAGGRGGHGGAPPYASHQELAARLA